MALLFVIAFVVLGVAITVGAVLLIVVPVAVGLALTGLAISIASSLRSKAMATSSGDRSMDETAIDRAAMGRLAKALAFVCGADHPTTVALKTAAETGASATSRPPAPCSCD